MNKLSWFPFYVNDWLTSLKILRMNIAEQGAYLRLLCYQWEDPHCSLPGDEEELQLLAMWKPDTTGNWAHVRRCFIRHPEDRTRLHNPRLYTEWLKGTQLSATRRQVSQDYWKSKKLQSQAGGTQPTTQNISKLSTTDRKHKGFTTIAEEIRTVADKHFPPV